MLLISSSARCCAALGAIKVRQLWNYPAWCVVTVLRMWKRIPKLLSALCNFIFQITLVLTPNSAVGAGDTFIAGMLYSLIYHDNDWTLLQKLGFSNELAGRKVLQEGFSGLGLIMQHYC